MEGNLGTGTDAEATEGAAYWPAPHSLLSLFSYTTQDHLPMAQLTVSGALPHEPLIKKMPP